MSKLHEVIPFHLNLDEIKALCFTLYLDFEELKGEGKTAKVIEIILFFQANGRLPDLQAYLEEKRPFIPWGDYFQALPDYASFKNNNPLPIPKQLPTRPDYFTGRQKEIEQLQHDLEAAQKVTLWAAGGMGKTAIALESLYRLDEKGALLERFPDGVIFFSFYGRNQNEELYQHIIHTYDKNDTDISLENASRHIVGKKLLLVFDGAEEAQDLSVALQLQMQNGLLITTRDRRSQGGGRIEVGLLPLPEAKQLLIKWSQNAVNDAIAKAICSEIGRLPLAIRIAGFYLDESGEAPTDYLTALQQTPIRELSQGAHQQESVAILLERTVAQLDEASQTTLALLGRVAFLPLPTEPLAAVVESGPLRTALTILHRYGLIERSEGQVALVHALIHTYARTHLPLTADTFNQLATHYTQFTTAESAKGMPGYQTLHPHRPHILAVLNHSVVTKSWEKANQLVWAMEDYLDIQGFSSARLQLLHIGVQAAQGLGSKQDEGAHLGHLGLAYSALGQVEKAITYHEQALAISRDIGHRQGEGAHLGNLGLAYRDLGQVEKAIDYYEQALAISREIGDRQGEGSDLGNLGNAYRALGQVEKAIIYYEQALAISREIGHRQGEGNRLGNLGNAYRALGQVEKAITYYEQALAISREIGDRQGEGSDLGNLGNAYSALGQVEKAITYHEQALAISRDIGHRQGEGSDLGNLGNAYSDLGQVEKAITYYEQALAISREIGHRQGEGLRAWNLGLLYEKSDPKRAVELMSILVQYEEEIGHPDAEADAEYVAKIKAKIKNK